MSGSRLLRRSLRYLPAVLAVGVAAAVLSFVLSTTRPEVYEASTTVQLDRIDLTSVFLGQYVQPQDSREVVASNAKLVNVSRVREAASSSLGGRPRPEELESMISTSTEPDTTLLTITVAGESAGQSARNANAVRTAFIAIRSMDARRQLDETEARARAEMERLESQGSTEALAQLRTRLNDVIALRAVTSGGVNTLEPAEVPQSASAPRPLRSAVLGGVLAVLLAVGLALARAYTDHRLRVIEELTELWKIPTLGVIPIAPTMDARRGTTPAAELVEAYSLAWTSVRYSNPGADVKTLMVSSASASEGKSTAALSLAAAAAAAGNRVLLVDADLRRPTLASRAAIRGPGLSEVLTRIGDLDDSIHPATFDWPGIERNLDVLPAGGTTPNPMGLLTSEFFGATLQQLRSRYDLVVIDTPPATMVGDARLVLERSDAAVVVGRIGVVRRDRFLRLKEIFEGSQTPVLGLLVNGGTRRREYAYGYRTAAGRDA